MATGMKKKCGAINYKDLNNFSCDFIQQGHDKERKNCEVERILSLKIKHKSLFLSILSSCLLESLNSQYILRF